LQEAEAVSRAGHCKKNISQVCPINSTATLLLVQSDRAVTKNF